MGDTDKTQTQSPDQGSAPAAGGTIHSSTEHGTVASHPERAIQPFLVAPTAANDFNTLGLDLVPVACLSLHDILFEFDSSFPLPTVAIMLKELPGLREKHKSLTGLLPPLSIFGHADPVGGHAYNKPLSGRRARAIYGAITHDLGLWQQLNNEEWHNQKIAKTMQDATGKPDGTPLKDLMQAYMNVLFANKLEKSEFLGKGADSHLKGDIQGCSDFNLQVILSKSENQSLTHKDRNAQNQPNRRVVVFLFRPGLKIRPNLWPCPAAEDPAITACRKRFFGPPKTGDLRIQAGSDRREFSKAGDTLACRFYDRVARLSPCERGLVVVLINVFLRLVYKDPEGKDRPLPPKLPVVVSFGDGSEISSTLDKDGKLSFETDSSRKSFTLKFSTASAMFVASAPGDPSSSSEELITESDVSSYVDKGFRVFKLPLKWSMRESDWENSSLLSGIFPLDAAVPSIGTIGSPALLRLDPHWLYARFEFFDRFYGHSDHSHLRIGVPAMLVDGFRIAPAARGAAANPDTRSNWTINITDNAKESQALPWIIQYKVDRSADAKPDSKSMLQLVNPDGSFVVSKDASTRTIEAINDKGRLAPGADRLKLYDLPALWKSTKYFTRLAGGGDDFFDKLTDAQIRGAFQPASLLTFSLDDIVITDDSQHQITLAAADRVAVFFHRFIQSADAGKTSTIGLYKYDDGKKQSFYSEMAMGGKYYISDYPNWTRLVITQGNMFEAFHLRTPDEAPNDVVGARAAVRWVDSIAAGQPAGNTFPGARPARKDKDFFSIQPFFDQLYNQTTLKYTGPGTTTQSIGRFDMALLRCCDQDSGNEVVTCLHYFRFLYNFIPNAPPNVAVSAAQTINLPATATIACAATSCNSPAGAITFQWAQANGPAASNIASPTAATTAVTFNAPGSYTFQVTATEAGLSRVAFAAVRVRAAGSPPAPPPPGPPAPPAATVSIYNAPTPAATITANRAQYIEDASRNIINRWNGDDAQNAHRTELVPKKAEDKITGKAILFIQPASAAANAHFNLSIVRPGAGQLGGRAWMQGIDGTGELGEQSSQPEGEFANGSYTAAHECGHGQSLPDEYNERWNAFSLDELSFQNNLPGDPYEPDGRSWDPGVPNAGNDSGMMTGVVMIRNRYFWHSAEFARAATGITFKIKYDTYDDFFVPPHANFPQRSYVYWPINDKIDDAAPPRGKRDLLLYSIGKDRYAQDLLPHGPFQGILVINVKLSFTFQNALASNATMRQVVSAVRADIQATLGDKWYATGKVQAGSAQEWEFTRCVIRFSPRFLISNGNTANAAYTGLLANIPPHFNVQVNNAHPANTRWNAAAPGNNLTLDVDLTDPNWQANVQTAFTAKFCEMIGFANVAAVTRAGLQPTIQKVITTNGDVQDI